MEILFLKDPHSFTTIDDAFGTVMQFMNMTTSQCKVCLIPTKNNAVIPFAVLSLLFKGRNDQ